MNANEFLALADKISKVEQNDDSAFRTILNESMDSMSLLDADLAKEFSVSRPTVNRWTNGHTVPHPAVRKPIFDFLETRARKLALQKNAKARSVSQESQPRPLA